MVFKGYNTNIYTQKAQSKIQFSSFQKKLAIKSYIIK